LILYVNGVIITGGERYRSGLRDMFGDMQDRVDVILFGAKLVRPEEREKPPGGCKPNPKFKKRLDKR